MFHLQAWQAVGVQGVHDPSGIGLRYYPPSTLKAKRIYWPPVRRLHNDSPKVARH
jgi:hypothetical protein